MLVGDLEVLRQFDSAGKLFIIRDRANDVQDAGALWQIQGLQPGLEPCCLFAIHRRVPAALALSVPVAGPLRFWDRDAKRLQVVADRLDGQRRQHRSLDCIGHNPLIDVGHATDGTDPHGVLGAVDRIERRDADLQLLQLEDFCLGDSQVNHDLIAGANDEGRGASPNAVAKLDVRFLDHAVEWRLDHQIFHRGERLFVGDFRQAYVLFLLSDGRCCWPIEEFFVPGLRFSQGGLSAGERQLRFENVIVGRRLQQLRETRLGSVTVCPRCGQCLFGLVKIAGVDIAEQIIQR